MSDRHASDWPILQVRFPICIVCQGFLLLPLHAPCRMLPMMVRIGFWRVLSVVKPLLLHWCSGCCIRAVFLCVSVCVFLDVVSVAEAVPYMMERLVAPHHPQVAKHSQQLPRWCPLQPTLSVVPSSCRDGASCVASDATNQVLDVLNLRCSCSHPHRPWPTTLEVSAWFPWC